MDTKVAVIGLGYVGLPLSLQFAKAGCNVLALDVDESKIANLRSGVSYFHHIDSSAIAEVIAAGCYTPSHDFQLLCQVDAIIACVPTPLNRNREPDLSYVIATGRAIGEALRPGALVVLESTTYPGTTDGEFRAIIEASSGLIAGADFNLAYSPEREDPGNPDSALASIPKVVGGYSGKCLERATTLYSRIVKKVVAVSSCGAAEATKLLENIFRSVNIALVNELKLIYESMGIDVWEVIEAAATKPFGFMPFYPGPGLGGHCIPIDPFYLTWKAREFKHNTRFIELAGEINTAMPEYVVKKVSQALNDRHLPLRESRVLLVGLAYKPDVDDERESPTYELMELLEAEGAVVEYYDPYIPRIGPTRRHGHREGQVSVTWKEETIRSFDAVVIATNHRTVNYRELASWASCIVDTRNAMNGIPEAGGKVTKA